MERRDDKQENVLVPIGIYYMMVDYFLVGNRKTEYETALTNYLQYKQDRRYERMQWRTQNLRKPTASA